MTNKGKKYWAIVSKKTGNIRVNMYGTYVIFGDDQKDEAKEYLELMKRNYYLTSIKITPYET